VEEGGEDGHLRAIVVVGYRNLPQRAAAVVVHGLGDAEVVHADADAAREEHGEPREVVELGALVLAPELQSAVLGEGDVQQKHRPDVLRADVEPGEVLRHPALPLPSLLVDALGRHQARDGEAPEDDDREQGRDPVQAEQTPRADVDRDPPGGAHEPAELRLVREVRDGVLVAPTHVVERHDADATPGGGVTAR
jgi:hypothetical protein